MGTSLEIRLKDRSIENADKADMFLDELELSKELTNGNDDIGRLYFYSQADLNWCNSGECSDPEYYVSFYEKRIGTMDYQLNSYHGEREYKLITECIIELSKNFEIEILYSSSTLGKDSWYFTMEQQREMTGNGTRLIAKYPDDKEYMSAFEDYLHYDLLQESYEERYGINVTSSKSKAVSAFMDAHKSNKNFFPTPKELVFKMLSHVDFGRTVKNVLEPSAGKGDIIEQSKEFKIHIDRNEREYDYAPLENADFSAIEKDQDLQNTLKGKGIKIVDSDFLTYNGLEQYDLILMNPPFDKGATHLHKALDVRGGSSHTQRARTTARSPTAWQRR